MRKITQEERAAVKTGIATVAIMMATATLIEGGRKVFRHLTKGESSSQRYVREEDYQEVKKEKEDILQTIVELQQSLHEEQMALRTLLSNRVLDEEFPYNIPNQG